MFALPANTQRQVATYGLICTVLIVTLVVYVWYWRKKREQQKLRALGMIDADVMDGLTFERYVAELLKSRGYTGVRLTERFDRGVDIIVVKDGIRWGVQVKRYSKAVKASAVQQVVAGLNSYGCQRAMVVTNNYFGRHAKLLAQDNNCVLVNKDELANWIIEFQQGNEGYADLKR